MKANLSRPGICNTSSRVPGKLGTTKIPARVTGILLLVDFPDVPTSFQRVDFLNMLNEKGYDKYGFNVMYAGIWGETWAQGLWPHRSPMEDTIQVDSVKISNYMIAGIQSAKKITNELTTGLYIHENGHQLFLWPDTYDHEYKKDKC